MPMRIATFNILGGRSPADDRVNIERFAGAIAQLDADVLALQEVDRNQPRSEHADLTTAAAEAMGATEHRFVAALSGERGDTWVAADGEEQPEAAAYGIALLTRYPVLAWQVTRLPALPTRVPMLFRGHRRPVWVTDEARVAVAAVVDTPRARMTVAGTHLSFIPGWNGRQLRLLMRSMATRPRPLVLMGDLNMGPRRAARLTGMRPLATDATFPAGGPDRQLDHVLLDGELPPVRFQAVQLPLSDHLAVIVDFADAEAGAG